MKLFMFLLAAAFGVMCWVTGIYFVLYLFDKLPYFNWAALWWTVGLFVSYIIVVIYYIVVED